MLEVAFLRNARQHFESIALARAVSDDVVNYEHPAMGVLDVRAAVDED